MQVKKADIYLKISQVYIYDAFERIHSHGKNAIIAFAEGDEQRVMLMSLKRLTKFENINIKNLRGGIADRLIADNHYNL